MAAGLGSAACTAAASVTRQQQRRPDAATSTLLTATGLKTAAIGNHCRKKLWTLHCEWINFTKEEALGQHKELSWIVEHSAMNYGFYATLIKLSRRNAVTYSQCTIGLGLLDRFISWEIFHLCTYCWERWQESAEQKRTELKAKGCAAENNSQLGWRVSVLHMLPCNSNIRNILSQK